MALKLSRFELARKELNKYFSEIYGRRWARLYEALEQQSPQIGRINRHSDWTLDELTDYPRWHKDLPNCLEGVWNLKVTPPFNDRGQRLKPYYTMNPSSFRAALELNVHKNHVVADLCAAPGGKSLIFHDIISEGNGKIVANDVDRKEKEHDECFSRISSARTIKRIQVTGMDAKLWGMMEKNRYDRVMLDVPCSAERHFLHSRKQAKRSRLDWYWSEKETMQLQAKQYSLLTSALESVKPGGEILYVTCYR
eukprot:UN00788